MSMLPELEFSRPLSVDKIPAPGVEETLIASDKERKELAQRFGLLDLKDLSATLSVHPASNRQGFAVTGTMNADVVQQCVVTLEPLANHIEHQIDVLFAFPEGDEAAPAQIEMDEDQPEHIIDGVIDLGELVAQHLGITLDPYPRKPGLAPVEAQYGSDKPTSPFAELINWPKKPKDSN